MLLDNAEDAVCGGPQRQVEQQREIAEAVETGSGQTQLACVNFRPWAVLTTTTLSSLPMVPLSRSLARAASATPVWGQLNMPAGSGRGKSSGRLGPQADHGAG